ncbi:hypothetical protein [Sphingobacterium gobiense]|uniref:Uncharacterized protein n=1 Tax=Sphingobacterium gobiense TaxID=1382456 RepID=A0A2S9JVM9_9SPHI|nr:hypothetical protein [Sphingobacterium gobiense]PRD57310.1 hypothetical protein C5749_08990 [Sphingobacterium gobiense]
MTYSEFISSIGNRDGVPDKLNVHLQALWYDAKGDWKIAHDLIDHLEDVTSAHVHAYLHRVEGDLWNARYWYNQAKQPEYKGSLKEEWEQLVKMLL